MQKHFGFFICDKFLEGICAYIYINTCFFFSCSICSTGVGLLYVNFYIRRVKPHKCMLKARSSKLGRSNENLPLQTGQSC